MISPWFDWVIGICAGGSMLLLCYGLLEAAESRTQRDMNSIMARIPSVRELARLTGLAPTLALLAVIGCAVLVAVVLAVLQGVGFATTVALVLVVGFLFSSRRIRKMADARYLRRFENQLPLVIDQTVAQLRGNRTLSQGFVALPSVLPEPAAREMFEIAERGVRGLGLDQALTQASQKYESRNFGLLLAVFRMFARQGGDVIVPLQSMSAAFKELIKADDFIRTASSQGRTMFWIINGAVFFIFALVSLAQPKMITAIFENLVGILAFLVGVGVYVAGAMWMWAMMKVDV